MNELTGAEPSGTVRGRAEGGQATVEFALCLPLVAIALLLLVQTALVVRARILVVEAAREGARAAARAESSSEAPAAAETAAQRTAGLREDRLQVSTANSGEHVTVEVSYRAPTDAPIIGAVLPEPALGATVTMRSEEIDTGEPP